MSGLKVCLLDSGIGKSLMTSQRAVNQVVNFENRCKQFEVKKQKI